MIKKIIFALIFSLLLTIIPWERIKKDSFEDLAVYEQLFKNYAAQRALPENQESLLNFVLQEGLWTFLILETADICQLEFRTIFYGITFIILFSWAFCLSGKSLTAPFFLVNPVTIDAAFSGLRNSLSFSLVAFALFVVRNNKFKTPFLLAAPLIHISSLFLLWQHFLISKTKVTYAQLQILGLVPVIVYFFILNDSGLSDIRFSFEYLHGAIGWKQQLFWLLLLTVAFCSGKKFLKENFIGVNILIWYAVFSFVIPWSYRIWGVSMPWLGYLMLNLKKPQKQILIFFYTIYVFLYFLYWIR